MAAQIIGIGTDIIECLRIAQMIDRHGELFIRLRGTLKPGRHEFGVVGQDSLGSKFAEGFSSIIYPHISPIRRSKSCNQAQIPQ